MPATGRQFVIRQRLGHLLHSNLATRRCAASDSSFWSHMCGGWNGSGRSRSFYHNFVPCPRLYCGLLLLWLLLTLSAGLLSYGFQMRVLWGYYGLFRSLASINLWWALLGTFIPTRWQTRSKSVANGLKWTCCLVYIHQLWALCFVLYCLQNSWWKNLFPCAFVCSLHGVTHVDNFCVANSHCNCFSHHARISSGFDNTGYMFLAHQPEKVKNPVVCAE